MDADDLSHLTAQELIAKKESIEAEIKANQELLDAVRNLCCKSMCKLLILIL